MGSIRVRKETGKLFLDFHYRNKRCREQTALDDTKANRRKLELALKKIEAEIMLGTFSYPDSFPGSNNAVKFQEEDLAKEKKKAGISTKQFDYGQQGMVCYIKLDNVVEQTAFQAFNPTGPVGLLPMNNKEGVFSIVWSMSEEQVPMWLGCDEQKFCHGLKAHINRDLGMPELLSKRVAFPLRKQQASDYVKGRVVLMGDAVHVVHPLAGQGVNLGLEDAACLAELLSELVAANSLKDSDALQRKLKKYQRMRKSKVAESLLMIDAIHHLFTRQQPPLTFLRATGMKLVNRINPLKSWLMAQAGS